MAKGLEQTGVDAAAIHGDKSQGQRERALADFKAGKVRVLVATDIAARGIDVDAITHVVNYDLPNVPEAYVHRIGRTARAGADGSAVAFCSDDERNLLKDIEKVSRQRIPSFDRRNDRHLGAVTAAMPDPGGKPERADTRGGARGGSGRAEAQPQRRRRRSWRGRVRASRRRQARLQGTQPRQPRPWRRRGPWRRSWRRRPDGFGLEFGRRLHRGLVEPLTSTMD